MSEQRIPHWIQDEIDHPLDLGEGRNNQMIRIGPTLLRNGHDENSLFELFNEMFPDATSAKQQHEIAACCRNAVKMAAKEDNYQGESAERRRELNQIARRHRAWLPSILTDYVWTLDEIRMQSLVNVDARRLFLDSLFMLDDVVWIGMVWETGQRKRGGTYAQKFKTVAEWLAKRVILGEFCSHCTFQPGTVSRCNDAVAVRRYLVVESDHLPITDMGAIFNYLQTRHHLILRAIVSTGGKSIHGWFDWPESNYKDQDEWSAILTGLRCDPSTLRPSQPVRLPGCIRGDTQRPQELLWLNT